MLGFFPKEGFLEPLSKILIFHGFCSERSFYTFFKNHNIYVDNKLVENPKILVDREKSFIKIVSKDESKAKVCTVLPPQSHLYILMHKPRNCVCSRVSDRSKTVYQVLKEALVKMGLFSKEEKLENQKNPNINLGEKITEKQFNQLSSLGRLDKDTTGLLLFSTNGSFIHFVTDEKNKIAKTYRVKLKKALTKEEQAFYEKQLESGIMLEAEKKAKPAFVKNQKVQWESENSCLFTIEQGIFHQVRRSFAALGNEVVELHRVKIGDLELPANLQPGNVKILLKNDIVKK